MRKGYHKAYLSQAFQVSNHVGRVQYKYWSLRTEICCKTECFFGLSTRLLFPSCASVLLKKVA